MPERSKTNPDREDELAVVERPRVDKPRRYVVVFHNDDYTTMDFVVRVLEKFFHMDETQATQVMLHVHHKGYGIVGVFTRDVAETKAMQVTAYAKEHSVDLIIMGTHGHGAIAHVLLGSTTEKVVRKAHCAVLTIRSKTPSGNSCP